MKYPREWERIDSKTFRLKVPGGWLVKHTQISNLADGPPPAGMPFALSVSVAMTFVADENHQQWDLEPLKVETADDEGPNATKRKSKGSGRGIIRL